MNDLIITGDLEMRSFLRISLKAVITFGDNIGDNICLHDNRKTARNALFLRLSELFL